MSRDTNNPNDAAAATSSADKTTPASCPLSSNYIQLLPIRYAFVENLAYQQVSTTDEKQKPHPIGLRFIRDGWLYIVDDKDGRVREYILQDGLVTKRTFKGLELYPTTRQSYDEIEQEDNKELCIIFKKDRKIYVSYSAVQWTDDKCKQMSQRVERKMFMQEVDLTKVSCEHLPEHLLTRIQAEKHIAEVAEEYQVPDYPVEFNEEKTAYSWTVTTFKKTSIGKLTAQLKKEYEQKGNYLFLTVQDYLGMMLDLTQEQRLVSKWLGDWSEKDNNSLKYQTAGYIESTLTVNPQNAAQKGASAWIDNLPPEKNQAIYDYINDKIAFDKEQIAYWQPATEQSGYEYVEVERTPKYYQRAAEVNTKKERMIALLGQADYNQHKAEIDALETNQKNHLDGEFFGSRGINKLVKIPEMKKYLSEQRPKYMRWQARLELITTERTRLYAKYYHIHTWYFALSQKEQLLKLEEELMSDLFRNDQATIAVSKFLEEKPYFHFPAIQTNFDVKYVTETLPTLVKWLADTNNYIEATTSQQPTTIQKLENLIGRDYWKQIFTATGNIADLQKIHALNLSQAVNYSLSNFMRELTGPILNPQGMQRFNSALDRYKHLTDQLGYSARTSFLLEIRKLGFIYITDTPGTSGRTTQALNTINRHLTNITNNQQALATALRQQEPLKDPASPESRHLGSEKARVTEYKKLSREIDGLQRDTRTSYEVIESNQNRLASLISPLADGEGSAAIRFNISSEQQVALDFERQALAAGWKTAYGQSGKGFAVSAKSSALPTFLLSFSLWNLSIAWEQFKKDAIYGDEQWLPLTGSLFGTIAAASSVWQSAHIAMINNIVDKIDTIKPGIAGADLLGKIGKLNIIIGGAGQIFGAFASYITLYTSFSKWCDGIMSGNTELAISSATSLFAASGNAAIGTYGLYHTAVFSAQVRSELKAGQIAARTVWSVRGAQYATSIGRVTPIGLFLTAVQLVAEYAYNYYNTSEFQNWFLYSCWGQSPKGWTQAEHNQTLAEALLKPVLIDKGVLEYQGKPYRTIQVLCPGQIKGSLNEHPIKWQAQWDYNFDFNDNTIGETLLQNTKAMGEGYIAFEWRLPWLPKNEWNRMTSRNVLNLRLFHTPDLANATLYGNQGIGYKIPLNSWTNDEGESIKQVAGNKVSINSTTPLITYEGKAYG